MDGLTIEVAEELAKAVTRNEGLRQAIETRGLPLKKTLNYLRDHHLELFRKAHQDKASV